MGYPPDRGTGNCLHAKQASLHHYMLASKQRVWSNQTRSIYRTNSGIVIRQVRQNMSCTVGGEVPFSNSGRCGSVIVHPPGASAWKQGN